MAIYQEESGVIPTQTVRSSSAVVQAVVQYGMRTPSVLQYS